MANVNPIINAFTSGEFSEKLYGITDIEKYFSGAGTLENVIVPATGSASKRPASYFAAEVKDSSKFTRSIPFQFNVEQSYKLEFGENYIRFYRNGGQILDGGNPYEIATTYLESELRALQYTQSNDVMYIAHPNHPLQKLARTGHTAWTIVAAPIVGGP